jgi:hypothetical protein
MRILGEFESHEVRITALHMNGRISIKYEFDLLEQTYKFRDGSDIQTFEDVQRFCDDIVMKSIRDTFDMMIILRNKKLEAIYLEKGEGFDVII